MIIPDLEKRVFSRLFFIFFFLCLFQPGNSQNAPNMSDNTKPKKYYAVRRGRRPGIYMNYNVCQKQVRGFPMNSFASFDTYEEAQDFMKHRSQSKNKSIKQQEGKLNSVWGKRGSKEPPQPKRKRYSEMVATSSSSAKRTTGLFKRQSKRQAVESESFSSIVQKEQNKKQDERSHDFSVPRFGPLKRLYQKPQLKDGPKLKRGEMYIDGSCNKTAAGVGVYFGPGWSQNISRRFNGSHTSCGAEIAAAIAALESTVDVKVHTHTHTHIHTHTYTHTYTHVHTHTQITATGLELDQLKNLMHQRDEFEKAYRHPTIYTDCKLLTDCMNKNYLFKWITTGKNNSGRKPKNLDLFVRIGELIQHRNVKWVFVNSHSGNPGNDAADALAKAGAREEDLPYFDVEDW